MDELQHTPCCQFADDDTIATDAAAFDCGACPVMEALEGLDPENRRAWNLMHTIASRFLADTHAVPLVLSRLTADDDPETLADLMTRLSIIYDVTCPPPKKERG